MSNRFHNKYHRHNHHTDRIDDPRYPDAAHDPIASVDFPFRGNFYMVGSLSATQGSLSAFAGSFVNVNGPGLNVEGLDLGLQVKGPANIIGTLSAQDIQFTSTSIINTYTEYQPVTATGEFLVIKIATEEGEGTGSMFRAIRLWHSSTFTD
jgi:hypothetical protein